MFSAMFSQYRSLTTALAFFLVFVFLSFVFAYYAIAGEATITFQWDAMTPHTSLHHYELHESDNQDGPWTLDTLVVDDIEPWSLVRYEFTSTRPDGVSTVKYFVLKSVNEAKTLRGTSNWVVWDYDFAPIVPPGNIVATLEGSDVVFSWTQADIGRVGLWKLYVSEIAGGPYEELASIIYTGDPGPQYSTTESMEVTEGEVKTFYFTLVTFNSPRYSFSSNSTEVSVTIDRRVLPVYNFRIVVE